MWSVSWRRPRLKKQKLQDAIETTVETFPIVSKCLGLPTTRRRDFSDNRAIALQRLSAQVAINGTSLNALCKAQAEADSIFHDVASSAQVDTFNNIVRGDGEPSANTIPSRGGADFVVEASSSRNLELYPSLCCQPSRKKGRIFVPA